ncbi:glycosyltransferase [Glutamicibacter sp.]|uniref:glycosyltransferase n=1 Tax=Glutamicibacter sp. TaxID=1931995 RepID=UPI0028BD823F|nr:glycosyltransferase [Glutamicibacter sp.]
MLQNSEPLDAYMVTWAVEEEFGGMTTVCLQRAAAFAERYGHASVVTFNPNPDYPAIFSSLRERGKISTKVRHLNLYENLSNRQLTQVQIAERKFSPEIDDFEFQSQQFYPTGQQHLFSQKSVSAARSDETQVRYFRIDGTVFLTDTKFWAEERRQRLIEVFDKQGQLSARFFSGPSLYRYWLSQLVDHEQALVVVDSKYTALHLNKWETTYVPKLYAFHSAHLTSGEDLLTGTLSEAHAPIIENRVHWDGFVFLTHAQRSAYVQRFGDAQKTFVIPNPVKVPHIDPPLPVRQPQHLIAAGSLTVNKNVAAAIRVVAELKSRGLDPVLNVVGKGSQREALSLLATQLGIAEQVVFHGYSDQLPRLFASCTVQLFCSRSEGQALVLLEAQQQGCIPISFNVNFGPSDSIINSKNGYLIEPDDIQGMADRAEHLMRHPQEAAIMSEDCRKFAQEYLARDLVALWRDTMIFTSRRKPGRKKKPALIPEFQADLQGIEFLNDGLLRLRVQHGTPLPDAGSYALVIVGRDSKEVVARIDAVETSGERAEFVVDQDLIATAQVPDSITDVNLECVIGTQRKMKRLGTPKSTALPYLTTHHNLSIKRSTE